MTDVPVVFGPWLSVTLDAMKLMAQDSSDVGDNPDAINLGCAITLTPIVEEGTILSYLNTGYYPGTLEWLAGPAGWIPPKKYEHLDYVEYPFTQNIVNLADEDLPTDADTYTVRMELIDTRNGNSLGTLSGNLICSSSVLTVPLLSTIKQLAPPPGNVTVNMLPVAETIPEGWLIVKSGGSTVGLDPTTFKDGGSSTITADDTPAAPAEGESASCLVTSAVTWPAGLVWSTDPDGGVAPTITGTALVSMFTVGGVTRAIMGATFPSVVPESPLVDAILALSPVGYWKLDETAGTQATDYSGNARHGTYGGNYTLAANGGLVTLGATGYVDCGDVDDWSYAGATDGFTVFALATRPSVPSSASAFMGKRGAGNAEWMAFLSGGANAGKMTFGGYTIDGSKVCTEERADSALTAIGSWNAYAFAAQPPSKNARIAMYENGRLLTSSNVGGTVNTFSNGAASLRIGGVEYSGWESNKFLPWNGSIGHVAVFRSTLTAGQVATLAAAAATEGLI